MPRRSSPRQRGASSGHVRVSAFPTAARSILVPALVDLVEHHPNLRTSMIDLEPEEALPALKGRELELVLTYEWDLLPTLEDPGVEREELLTEPVYLVLPPEHPLALRGGPVAIAELADEQWIVGRDSTSMLDLVAAAGRRSGFEPRTDIHSMDFEVILAAVAAGLGRRARTGTRASLRDTEGRGPRGRGPAAQPLDLGGVPARQRREPGIAAVLESLRVAADRLTCTLQQPL